MAVRPQSAWGSFLHSRMVPEKWPNGELDPSRRALVEEQTGYDIWAIAAWRTNSASAGANRRHTLAGKLRSLGYSGPGSARPAVSGAHSNTNRSAGPSSAASSSSHPSRRVTSWAALPTVIANVHHGNVREHLVVAALVPQLLRHFGFRSFFMSSSARYQSSWSDPMGQPRSCHSWYASAAMAFSSTLSERPW